MRSSNRIRKNGEGSVAITLLGEWAELDPQGPALNALFVPASALLRRNVQKPAPNLGALNALPWAGAGVRRSVARGVRAHGLGQDVQALETWLAARATGSVS